MPSNPPFNDPRQSADRPASRRSLRGYIGSRYIRVLILPLLALCGWAVYASYHSTYGSKFPDFRNKVYFLDEETQEVIIKTDADIPPLLGRAGKPTVVQAIYQTTTNCRDKTLVYLLKYTDEAKAAIDEKERKLDRFRYSILIDYANQVLVRRPEPGSPWVPYTSAEGMAIMNSLPRPANTAVKSCNPADEAK